MSNLVPFNAEGALPSTIINRQRLIDVNKDIVTTAPFPSLSIKGKVFTLVQDNEKKVLTKPDDPDEVLQSVTLVPLRINMKAKTYYSKQFKEGESDGVRPDCYSFDGVAPSATSPKKQAEKCALCPHNVWGSRVSEDGTGSGKACSDHARVAIAAPDKLDKPFLLRVPPKSLRPLKDALKLVKQKGIQYNEVILKVGFVAAEASPVLTFKPAAVLDDATYAKACELFDSEVVRAIVGADEDAAAAAHAAPAPAVEADELDAALAARDATRKAAAAAPAAKAAPAVTADELDEAVAAPAPAPVPAPAPAKAAKSKAAAPAPAAAAPAEGGLMGELDDLLGGFDA